LQIVGDEGFGGGGGMANFTFPDHDDFDIIKKKVVTELHIDS
jgi:hypothetical protein